jgi:hypothetical protein
MGGLSLPRAPFSGLALRQRARCRFTHYPVEYSGFARPNPTEPIVNRPEADLWPGLTSGLPVIRPNGPDFLDVATDHRHVRDINDS